jgi:hypothetical protein
MVISGANLNCTCRPAKEFHCNANWSRSTSDDKEQEARIAPLLCFPFLSLIHLTHWRGPEALISRPWHVFAVAFLCISPDVLTTSCLHRVHISKHKLSYHWITDTNWLTPRSSVLQKLTVTQLVKKFPAFYGTRRFITVFTTARHRSLACQLHPILTFPPYFPKIHSNIILPSMPRSSEWSLHFLQGLYVNDAR